MLVLPPEQPSDDGAEEVDRRALAADEESSGLRTIRRVLKIRSRAQGIWVSYVVRSDEREEVGPERQAIIGRHHNFINTHIPKGVRKHETATPDLVDVR